MEPMAQPRVLVTGATGFFGPFVVAELRRAAQVVTLARRGADLCCDIADPAALAAALAAARADHVVHLAAMSRIATCAGDAAGARAVNATAAAEIAARFGPRLLYVSTDLVFDGRSAPYGPLDAVGPLSAYGQSKAEGEERVLAAGGRVVRLPLLFGHDAAGRGATAMIRSGLAAGRTVALFTNEYRSPLHARDGARGVAELLFRPDSPPVEHLPGPERLSRWDFGTRFCALHRLPRELLRAVECQDATRPRDVSFRGRWQPPRDLDAMLRDS